MDNTTKKIEWSENLEKYFKEMGERSYCYSYLHKKCENHFSYTTTFLDLPVIILSTIAGTLSIGGTSFWGKENEHNGSLAVGLMSLSVGVMNTINTYFGFSKRAENHRLSHIQYGKLFRFISIELSLPRNERIMPFDLLKMCRDTYERLQEISPLIPQKILDDFKSRFKGYTVSKPAEANGLEEIVIYGGEKSISYIPVKINENQEESIDDMENKIINQLSMKTI